MKTTKKKQRKNSSLWNRRPNTVPLDQRGAFQLPESADYISRSITTMRRLIRRGEIRRLPGFRDIVIPKEELDRYLRRQLDLAQMASRSFTGVGVSAPE